MIFKVKLSKKGIIEHSTFPVQIADFQPLLEKDLVKLQQ